MRDCILIVDDDPMLLELFDELLNDQYTVLTANRVRDAMHIVDSQDVSAVLTDLHIGADNGLDFLIWIKAHHPQLASKVILLTGAAASEHLVDGSFLTKPIKAKELRDAVAQVLQEE